MRTRKHLAILAALMLVAGAACDSSSDGGTDAVSDADTSASADGEVSGETDDDTSGEALAACIESKGVPAGTSPEPDNRCAGNTGCTDLGVLCGECACTVCFDEGCILGICDSGGPGCEVPPDVTDTSDTDSADTAADTGTDTAADTGTDTAADTGTDTAADTGADTAADTGTDTAADTAADTGTDTVTDTGPDTAGDTAVDTAGDTAVDTGSDTGSDTADATDAGDTQDVGPGQCTVEVPCDGSGFESCWDPDDPFCGACFQTMFPCSTDGDCTLDGLVCGKPAKCSCDGQNECKPGCASAAECAVGESCDSGGHCVATVCDSGADCPTDFDCEDDQTCARRSCTSSTQCDGYCVKGFCWPNPGFCSQPPP